MKTEKNKTKSKGFLYLCLLGMLCAGLTGCAVSGAQADGDADQRVAEKGNLRLILPEGYDESTTSGLYLNKDYPDDQSNLYLYTTEKDADFLATMQNGQEEFTEHLAAAYQEQYGERPEITVVQYLAAKVGDYDAYVVELTYTLQDVFYDQLEYIVDADQTYYVAFSQVGAYEWMELFRESAQSIYFADTQKP